jgi:hypothetical protein
VALQISGSSWHDNDVGESSIFGRDQKLPVEQASAALATGINEPDGDSKGNTIVRQARISMRQSTIRFLSCLMICLAGSTNYIFFTPTYAFGADTKSPVVTTPKVDHILLEVSDLKPRLCDVGI